MGLMHGFLDRVAAARQLEQMACELPSGSKLRCTCDALGKCFLCRAQEKRDRRATEARRSKLRGPVARRRSA